MLSDTKIRKAAPAERDYKLADEKGLFLLVRKNGGKLWRMKYRVAGKEKLLSFGPYPDVTLTDARDARDAARRLLREGVDPSAEKKRDAKAARLEEAHSFESVAREWHELNKGRWTAVHQYDVIRSLERDVFPTIGKTAIGSLEAHDVFDLLRTIEKRGSIETAKRIRQRISGVFLLAISKRIARDNPAKDLNAAVLPKKKAKKQPAIVDLKELCDLLTKTEESGASPVTLLASRLLAMTAVRPGAARAARWEEFVNIFDDEKRDEAYWHIPAERMKLTLDRKDEEAFDHVVPLTPQVVDVLRAVHRPCRDAASWYSPASATPITDSQQ